MVLIEELKLISENLGNKYYLICNKYYTSIFPENFEVQDLINLSESVWDNLKAIRTHWNSIITSASVNKIEKTTAKGFLKLWKEGGDQEYYTVIMIDVLRQFEKISKKKGQKSMTTLCDIETTKMGVLESLTIIQSNFFPGGREDLKNMLCDVELEHEDDDDNIRTRTIRNSYVSTCHCVSSVKNEIRLSRLKYFLNA